MTSSVQNISGARRGFWAVAILYLLIAFEFFYMASPFAIYFYSAYGPGLNFINDSPALAWLSSLFLPHIVADTSSALLNLRSLAGVILASIGFLVFCIGAGQVYYYKLARKGAVTGGVYNVIRHPQYLGLAVCSLGLLLLWPRYIVLLSFIAMLFAYYFLAKAEENECEKRYGRAYREYKERTNMFLPFRVPLLAGTCPASPALQGGVKSIRPDHGGHNIMKPPCRKAPPFRAESFNRLPGLPEGGVGRYLTILALYAVICLMAVGLANGLRNWSINRLYAFFLEDSAYISVAKVEEDRFRKIVDIASGDAEVRARLEREGTGNGTKLINYVLPAKWYVAEIPMNPVDGAARGHYHPEDRSKNEYKIIFTRAEPRSGREAEGKKILLNTSKRVPIVEVSVNLSQRRVAGIKNPPATIKYENIPVPLF